MMFMVIERDISKARWVMASDGVGKLNWLVGLKIKIKKFGIRDM